MTVLKATARSSFVFGIGRLTAVITVISTPLSVNTSRPFEAPPNIGIRLPDSWASIENERRRHTPVRRPRSALGTSFCPTISASSTSIVRPVRSGIEIVARSLNSRVLIEDPSNLLDCGGSALSRVTGVHHELRLDALEMRASVLDYSVIAFLDRPPTFDCNNGVNVHTGGNRQ